MQDPDTSVFGIAAHDDRHALYNLLEALRIAESAAQQLAFYTQNQRWLLVRHNFGTLREVCTALAQSDLLKTKPN